MTKLGYAQTEDHRRHIKLNNAKYWLNKKLSKQSIEKRTASRAGYCTSEATKLKLSSSVSKTKQEIRKARLGDDYGLTALQIQEKQAGRQKTEHCEICKRKVKTQFDHDHNTGKFRGWICWKCNIILGLSKDDAMLLKELANYLEKHTS